jgi:hypothetical protein
MITDSEPKSESPQLGWTYIPLIAYAIIVLGLMFIAYARPSPEADSGYYGGAIVIFVLLALAHWALIGLYAVTNKKAKNEWPEIGSVRAAMWSSLIAMLVAYAAAILLIFYSIMETEGQRGAAIGVAFFVVVILCTFIFILPIFGLIGWLAGRRIHRRLKRSQMVGSL